MDIDNIYSHRINSDGTIDAIRHRCFATVATATDESDLERCERNHICNPEDALRSDVIAEEAKLWSWHSGFDHPLKCISLFAAFSIPRL